MELLSGKPDGAAKRWKEGDTMTGTPLIDDARFRSGLNWAGYLEWIPESRAMQSRRYEAAHREFVHSPKPLAHPHRLVVLSMPRCGDCAWAIPRLMRWAEETEGLEARIFLRNKNEDLMDRLLTGDSRSIPKAALIDEAGAIVGTWGPRPAPIQQYVEENKNRLEASEWKANVLKLYKEKGVTLLFEEFAALMPVEPPNHNAGSST